MSCSSPSSWTVAAGRGEGEGAFAMPVTKVMKISALKCTESVWRPGFARTHWGELTAPPDLAGFNSGGRDKGRRKGEGGDRQLIEGG